MAIPVLDSGTRVAHQRMRLGWPPPSVLAQRLTLIVVGLASVATGAGLLAPELYEDGPGVRAMFRGYDLVTLAVVVPTMLAALRAARRRSVRGHLVWVGTLGFTVYNYALYVFGAAFNDLFLVHVGVLVAATVALGVELLRLCRHTAVDVPTHAARQAAGLLALLGAGLGGMWVFYAMRFALTGDTPAESELVVPLAATHLGYALDLTVLVPAYLFAASVLWRGRPWGAVLGAVLFVAGLGQQLTYMAALVFQARADVAGATAFDPAEPFIVAAYAIGGALLLRHAHQAQRSRP